MKHRSVLVVVMLVALLALSGMSVIYAQDETIKIGLGFDLTGAESSLDLPASNGALLAIDEINARWGERTIHSGSTTGMKGVVKTKIPFGSTRYM